MVRVSQWRVLFQQAANTATILNRQNNRDEASTGPVIASFTTASPKDAGIVWNYTTSDGYPKIRYSLFLYNSLADKHKWLFDEEYSESNQAARFHAITAKADSERFFVTLGEESLYHIASQKIPRTAWVSLNGRREVEIGDTLDLWRVRTAEPKILDGQNTVGGLQNRGAPDCAFDGSANGPGILQLMKSQTWLLEMTQSISWDLNFSFKDACAQRFHVRRQQDVRRECRHDYREQQHRGDIEGIRGHHCYAWLRTATGILPEHSHLCVSPAFI